MAEYDDDQVPVLHRTISHVRAHETPANGGDAVSTLSTFEIEEPDYIDVTPSDLDSSESRYYMYQGHRVVVSTNDITKSSKLKWQMLSGISFMMYLGMFDQSLGSLMEYILEDYHIDRVDMSLLFTVQMFGYIPASILNHYFLSSYGLYTSYLTGIALCIVYTVVFSQKMPFTAVLIATVLNGLGVGTADCTMNIFVGNLKYANQLLGVMHSFYGVGCLTTPVLSVYLLKKGMAWEHYFLILMATLVVNFVIILFSFRDETRWKFLMVSEMERKESGDMGDEVTVIESMSNKHIQFYSFALFMYIGSELSMGVWLFNYMLNIKHMSDQNSAYVTSGYWIAVTLGRLVLSLVTGRWFENREVRAMTIFTGFVSIACLGFYLFEDITEIQIIFILMTGFFVGPVFGTNVTIAIHTLPKRYSHSSVSLIVGLGCTGAALIPPINGWIAEHFNGGNGQGLVHFPLSAAITFTGSFLLWLIFYLKHRTQLDLGERLD